MFNENNRVSISGGEKINKQSEAFQVIIYLQGRLSSSSILKVSVVYLIAVCGSCGLSTGHHISAQIAPECTSFVADCADGFCFC